MEVVQQYHGVPVVGPHSAGSTWVECLEHGSC